MKIYKNQYGWSVLCSNKYNGQEAKCYMPVSFKKGTEPAGTEGNINVTEFFMSAYKGKDGVDKPRMVVTEYVFVAPKEDNSNFGGETKVNSSLIDSDDLPFYGG